MGTRKEGFKKRTVAGKYRGYGIVGSYFGWTFEFSKPNVFCFLSCELERLSLKQGTGNRRMGMGNGEREIFKMGNL